VVLYELLTGKRAFQGESLVETLGAVIHQEPDWGAVPERARRLLQWCLEKDPKRRLQAIGDARRVLEEVPERVEEAPAPSRWSDHFCERFAASGRPTDKIVRSCGAHDGGQPPLKSRRGSRQEPKQRRRSSVVVKLRKLSGV
jgi:serine/threonine protein kinase